MSKKDLFAQEFAPRDRKAEADAIAAFMQKGGKVTKLKDSKETNILLARRARLQKAANARALKENPQGVIGGRPLFSNIEALTVKE
jgi:hypothetical protein